MKGAVNTAVLFQNLFNFLGWTGISKTLIVYEEKRNGYRLETPWIPSLTIHILFRINYLAKIVYLFFLLSGAFPDIGFEFLDYLTVGFWFLVIGLIFISEGLWFRRYPFFEIICAGWKIQNEIYCKLRNREIFHRSLEISVIKKAIFQGVIMAIGTLAMAFQYSAMPKYPIFTGYLIEEDSLRMTILVGFHDIGFLLTAWLFYGSVICLSSLLGRQLSLTLDYMTDELELLIKNQKRNNSDEQSVNFVNIDVLEDAISRENSESGFRSYTIDTIVADYKKLMIYMDLLNEFVSYKFLFIHITAYIQMIGDVFIMIQILRSGGEFMDVFFYMEDCGVCMYMLFKCFKAMSLVKPAAEKFCHTYTTYLIGRVPHRTFYSKVRKTIRPVSLKIGPNTVEPITPGDAMMVLMNYYIAAALW